jgi:hypothetical protein
MRRTVVALTAAGALALGLGAGTAGADVHAVSQAGCAAADAPSEGSRAAPGRPDAPIPVTASDGRTQGEAGHAPAQGTNC